MSKIKLLDNQVSIFEIQIQDEDPFEKYDVEYKEKLEKEVEKMFNDEFNKFAKRFGKIDKKEFRELTERLDWVSLKIVAKQEYQGNNWDDFLTACEDRIEYKNRCHDLMFGNSVEYSRYSKSITEYLAKNN